MAAGASAPGTVANQTDGPEPSTRRATSLRPLRPYRDSQAPSTSRDSTTPAPSARSATGARPPVHSSAVTSRSQPRRSSSAQSISSVPSAPVAVCTYAGRPRSPYQRRTAVSAASSGIPGSPSGSTELARRVNPDAARSSHSPSRSLSTGRQARAATRASSS